MIVQIMSLDRPIFESEGKMKEQMKNLKRHLLIALLIMEPMRLMRKKELQPIILSQVYSQIGKVQLKSVPTNYQRVS